MSTQIADPRPESSELQTEGPTPARLWGDQWLRVSEKVLKGLSLQFANRVAALGALSAELERQPPTDTSAARALSGEVERLNHLLQLFRLMTAEPFVTTEPLRLQDVIPQVLDLHAHHPDLRGIPVEVQASPQVSPLLARPSAMLRCLLVLLESAAGHALRSGAPARVSLSYSGDSTRIVVVIEGPAPVGTLLFTGDGSLVYAVRTALAHAHGTADTQLVPDAPAPRLRYEIVLPTLAESRRLESQAL